MCHAREGGSAHRVAVARTVESAGGKLEAIYFAFRDVDAYMIIDLADNATAAAVSLTANRLYSEQDHRAYDRRRDRPGDQKDGRISSTGR
jgi:GYD domain